MEECTFPVQCKRIAAEHRNEFSGSPVSMTIIEEFVES